jgi:biotin carboxylase
MLVGFTWSLSLPAHSLAQRAGAQHRRIYVAWLRTSTGHKVGARDITLQTVSSARISLFCLQDKHAQKHHFAAAGVPVAPFADVESEAALQAAAADFGFPLMLKSKRCAAARLLFQDCYLLY